MNIWTHLIGFLVFKKKLKPTLLVLLDSWNFWTEMQTLRIGNNLESITSFVLRKSGRKYYSLIFFSLCCFFSLFIWSNDSVNIWTHLIGFLIFFSLMVRDNMLPFYHGVHHHGSAWHRFLDHTVVTAGLVCFQVYQNAISIWWVYGKVVLLESWFYFASNPEFCKLSVGISCT